MGQTTKLTKDLDRVLLSNKVDDLESVLDDSDSHDLFTVVSAVHHERVDQSLNDGHSSLCELLLGISASSVGWQVSRCDSAEQR